MRVRQPRPPDLKWAITSASRRIVTERFSTGPGGRPRDCLSQHITLSVIAERKTTSLNTSQPLKLNNRARRGSSRVGAV